MLCYQFVGVSTSIRTYHLIISEICRRILKLLNLLDEIIQYFILASRISRLFNDLFKIPVFDCAIAAEFDHFLGAFHWILFPYFHIQIIINFHFPAVGDRLSIHWAFVFAFEPGLQTRKAKTVLAWQCQWLGHKIMANAAFWVDFFLFWRSFILLPFLIFLQVRILLFVI